MNTVHFIALASNTNSHGGGIYGACNELLNGINQYGLLKVSICFTPVIICTFVICIVTILMINECGTKYYDLGLKFFYYFIYSLIWAIVVGSILIP